MSDLDNIILDLQIIKQIKENDKLALIKELGTQTISVDNYSYLSPLSRWYYGYNRTNTIEYLEQLIFKIENISKFLNEGSHTNMSKILSKNLEDSMKGFENLKKHIENMRIFGVPFVVAVNKFTADTPAELKRLIDMCRAEDVRVAVSDVFSRGSEGGQELAEEIIKAINEDKHDFKPLYPIDLPLIEKIETVAKQAFGAGSVAMEGKTRRQIRKLEENGFKDLPICIAKTQYSLSSDDHALGRPEDFILIVTDVAVSAGAGFVVVYCGDIMTMPGLPKVPSAEKIDINDEGEIIGLS